MKLIRKTQPVIIASYLVVTCFILFIILINLGFRSNGKINRTVGNPDSAFQGYESLYPKDQLVIWLKKGTTSSVLTAWLVKMEADHGTIIKKAMCHDCDDRLMLLTGPGIENFIQQSVVSGGPGSPSGGPLQGENGILYYSANYKTDLNDKISTPIRQNEYLRRQLPHSKKPPPVIVAVFDTGIDPSYFNNLYFYHIPPGKSCLGPIADNGWNFSVIAANNNWFDDFHEKHGSVVSRFIVDQVNAGDGNGVQLLPVKTHDAAGKSNLFNVLCGFSYAAKAGAKIINASFGFYTTRSSKSGANPNSNIVLLKEYVKEYLTKNNILLIAAAGNKDPMENTPDFAKLSVIAKRNLDIVNFFPASLAADPDLPNVIAVTTVNNTTVCPKQNFSPHVVDIGVNADNAIQYTFVNPLGWPNPVIGSSFATPIVTGKICSNYYLFEKAIRRPGFKKSDIIKILLDNHLAQPNPSLTNKINYGGLVMKK